jgi:hypothetical protein
MVIAVRLLTEQDPSGNGIRIYARAQDGTGRVWFKWYENEATLSADAEDMQLIADKRIVGARGLTATVQRRLLDQADVDDLVLDADWHKA